MNQFIPEGGECYDTAPQKYKMYKTSKNTKCIGSKPANGESGECREVEETVTVVGFVRVDKL